MIKIKNFSVFNLVAILAIAYFSWQLVGLRFTNHDDIYFHLYSQIFSNDYFLFAQDTASNQARVQAFLNMPIILWADSLQRSLWFDVINISAFIVLCASITIFLSRIVGKSEALILSAVMAITFPLHYYFTFPQGYPVMGPYGLVLALFSAILLDSYLKNPKAIKIIGSAILFFCSLWGPEYNFVLHPIFLLFVLFARGKNIGSKNLYSLGWPYALGWLVSVGGYLIFSQISRDIGGDAYGRISFGFDFFAWIKTFLILQEKAFLPIALFRGVGLVGANAQGVPNMPAALNYASIWHAYWDWYSIVVVFSIFVALFSVFLFFQRFTKKSIIIASALFLIIAVVPALVVSASSHYQDIVLKGWLQGHLVAFYSHIGFSGLLFLFFVAVINKTKSKMRLITIATASLLLASYATVTFVYNNANRQAMMANKQKWDAMDLLVSYIRNDRPDLLSTKFYAPDFWTSTGVSSIPDDSPFNGSNYWTLYSGAVLGQELIFLNNSPEIGSDGVGVGYSSTPGGDPIVYFEDYKSKDVVKRTVLSLRPVAGVFLDVHTGSLVKKVTLDDWICNRYCITIVSGDSEMSPLNLMFRPDNFGPENLLSQFLMKRFNGYGNPVAVADELFSLQVENWSPQNGTVGVVPNLQPDGSVGFWIKLSQKVFSSNLQVIVDDHFASKTTVSPELITAAIDAEIFRTPGKKKVVVKNLANGSEVYVGEIVINAE